MMKRGAAGLAGAACLALAACGGGGGGVNSMPTPTPGPTPSGNTTLTDLRYSQTFANDAARSTPSFDLAARTTADTDAEPTTMTISYDAAAKSYTVTSPTGSRTFTPADLDPSSDALQAVYVKDSGSISDYLTLAKTPYTSATPNRYVQMGFWQHNSSTFEKQDTAFDIFAFGLPTPSANVPRGGEGKFAIDVFGFVTVPNVTPRTIQGVGSFNVDFDTGVFSTHTYVDEYDLISGDGTFGALELVGSGYLGSGGTFSGNIAYSGGAVPPAGVHGSVSGRFYGPAAEELGAAFAAESADGMALAGSFTGRREDSLASVTQTLTNIITETRVQAPGHLLQMTATDGEAGFDDVRTYESNSTATLEPDGDIVYNSSDLSLVTFTPEDAVASDDADFAAYRKTVDGEQVSAEFYKPGPGNGELALTYAGFGDWRATSHEGLREGRTRSLSSYFAYGIETPREVLAGRTGHGRYEGVAYGSGANEARSVRYDVTGTSAFDVNFNRRSYTATLTLDGTPDDGGAVEHFGSFDFAATLPNPNDATAEHNGDPGGGTMNTRFYGPDAEEIAGSFEMSIVEGAGSVTHLIGAVAARRQ